VHGILKNFDRTGKEYASLVEEAERQGQGIGSDYDYETSPQSVIDAAKEDKYPYMGASTEMDPVEWYSRLRDTAPNPMEILLRGIRTVGQGAVGKPKKQERQLFPGTETESLALYRSLTEGSSVSLSDIGQMILGNRSHFPEDATEHPVPMATVGGLLRSHDGSMFGGMEQDAGVLKQLLAYGDRFDPRVSRSKRTTNGIEPQTHTFLLTAAVHASARMPEIDTPTPAERRARQKLTQKQVEARIAEQRSNILRESFATGFDRTLGHKRRVEEARLQRYQHDDTDLDVLTGTSTPKRVQETITRIRESEDVRQYGSRHRLDIRNADDRRLLVAADQQENFSGIQQLRMRYPNFDVNKIRAMYDAGEIPAGDIARSDMMPMLLDALIRQKGTTADNLSSLRSYLNELGTGLRTADDWDQLGPHEVRAMAQNESYRYKYLSGMGYPGDHLLGEVSQTRSMLDNLGLLARPSRVTDDPIEGVTDLKVSEFRGHESALGSEMSIAEAGEAYRRLAPLQGEDAYTSPEALNQQIREHARYMGFAERAEALTGRTVETIQHATTVAEGYRNPEAPESPRGNPNMRTRRDYTKSTSGEVISTYTPGVLTDRTQKDQFALYLDAAMNYMVDSSNGIPAESLANTPENKDRWSKSRVRDELMTRIKAGSTEHAITTLGSLHELHQEFRGNDARFTQEHLERVARILLPTIPAEHRANRIAAAFGADSTFSREGQNFLFGSHRRNADPSVRNIAEAANFQVRALTDSRYETDTEEGLESRMRRGIKFPAKAPFYIAEQIYAEKLNPEQRALMDADNNQLNIMVAHAGTGKTTAAMGVVARVMANKPDHVEVHVNAFTTTATEEQRIRQRDQFAQASQIKVSTLDARAMGIWSQFSTVMRDEKITLDRLATKAQPGEKRRRTVIERLQAGTGLKIDAFEKASAQGFSLAGYGISARGTKYGAFDIAPVVTRAFDGALNRHFGKTPTHPGISLQELFDRDPAFKADLQKDGASHPSVRNRKIF